MKKFSPLKKFSVSFICASLCAVCAFAFCGCCLSYSYESINGIGIGYSESENRAFVSDIEWKNGDSQEIILPNAFNGYSVKALGGYIGTGCPCPFMLNIDTESVYEEADEYITFPEDYLYDDTINWWTEKTVTDYDFVITLPNGLDSVTYVDYSVYAALYKNTDGEISAKIIRPRYYFRIAENNESFYTENGKLYEKETGKLITDFIYTADEAVD